MVLKHFQSDFDKNIPDYSVKNELTITVLTEVLITTVSVTD